MVCKSLRPVSLVMDPYFRAAMLLGHPLQASEQASKRAMADESSDDESDALTPRRGQRKRMKKKQQ